jgi:hypothetical protein
MKMLYTFFLLLDSYQYDVYVHINSCLNRYNFFMLNFLIFLGEVVSFY